MRAHTVCFILPRPPLIRDTQVEVELDVEPFPIVEEEFLGYGGMCIYLIM